MDTKSTPRRPFQNPYASPERTRRLPTEDDASAIADGQARAAPTSPTPESAAQVRLERLSLRADRRDALESDAVEPVTGESSDSIH